MSQQTNNKKAKNQKSQPKPKVRPRVVVRRVTPKQPSMRQVDRELLERVKSTRKSELTPILANIVLPGVPCLPPERLSMPYENFPSSVAAPYEYFETSWDNDESTKPAILGLPLGQTFAAVSRNPLTAYAFWNVRKGASRSDVTYQAYFSASRGFSDYAGMTLHNDRDVYLNFGYLTTDTGSDVGHGITYYPVEIGGRKAIWLGVWGDAGGLPAGARLNFEGHVTGIDTLKFPKWNEAITIWMEKWTGDGWEPGYSTYAHVEEENDGSFEAIMYAQSAGYYSISISYSADHLPPFTPEPPVVIEYPKRFQEAPRVDPQPPPLLIDVVNFRMDMELTDRQVCFRPVPWFESIVESVSMARIVGASVMVTQTSTVLSQGGRIAGAQFRNVSIDELFNATAGDTTHTSDVFALVAQQSGSEPLTLDKGMYAWHKPMSIEELAMKNIVTLSGQEPIRYSNPLVTDWLVVCAVAPNGSPASAVAQFKFCFQMEFLSQNLFFPTGYARANATDLMDIFQRLMREPQFYENPLHLRELWKVVRKVLKFGLTNAPLIGTILSTMSGGAIPKIPAMESGLVALGGRL